MADRSPQAVKACHELLQWMIPLLDKFPRIRRFTLGGRIENNLLTVLESLVEAAYSKVGWVSGSVTRQIDALPCRVTPSASLQVNLVYGLRH